MRSDELEEEWHVADAMANDGIYIIFAFILFASQLI
jgi:hypothetical protein